MMEQSSRLQLVVVALLAVATLTTSLSTSPSPSPGTEVVTTELDTSVPSFSEPPMCDVNSSSLVHDEHKRMENSLTFNWTLIPESSVYSCSVTICLQSMPDECQKPLTNVSSGSVTFRQLIPGTTYNATLNVSNGQDLVTAASAIGTTYLIPPISPVVQNVTETAITVSWTPPNATYDIVVLNCAGLDGANNNIVNITEHTSHGTCVRLTPGALYNITLSTTLNNNSAPPATTDILQAVTQPLKPDGITVETVNTSAVNLSVQYQYNETTGQCTVFRIKYTGNGTDNEDYEMNITCPHKSVILSSLENNTLYVVSVSTLSKFTGKVSVRESNSTSNIGWTLPEQVSEPAVVSRGSRWVLTNWMEVANPESVGMYVLWVSSNGVCQQQVPLSVSGGVEVIPDDCNKTCARYHKITAFDITGYNITELTPYHSYELSVTAVNPGGCGQESDTYNVTTREDIPGVVGQPSIKPYNISLNASWSPPNEPNGIICNYTISWCQLNRVAEEYSLTGLKNCENYTTMDNKTNYAINGLDSYTNYSVSVAASTAIGRGEFVEATSATLTGVPYPAINVTASPLGYNATDVVWSLEDSAYPTGPLVGYKVTATPLYNYTNVSVGYEDVEGFESNGTIIDGLDAHVIYNVCVQAYAVDDNNEKFWSSVSNPCDQVQTQEAAPTAVRDISAPVDDICDKMTIHWHPPSPANGILQKYEVTLVNLADISDVISATFDHKGSQQDIQNCTLPVDPNDKTYNISIKAKTNYVAYGPANSITQTSGRCSPTSVDPGVISNPMKKSKTTFDVELTRCSLCHNSNGDITFVGLIITENLELENKEYNYNSTAELDKVFRSWDAYNETLGYRTTPDNWKTMIDCNVSCSGTGSARRYRRETISDKYTYTVGASGDCDGFCNHKLDDSKNIRRFKVRLVLGTFGGIIVMKMSDDVYELKPNKAWIAGPVVVCVLLAVALVIVFIMQRRRLGPFKENRNSTRTVQFPPGTTNPAFVDDPATERPSPVKISDFEDYVAQRTSDSEMIFSEEYKLIQDLSPKHPYTHAELPNNRLKNRFVNILPFDHSRVKLQAADDDDSSDYINANYMPGYNSKREFIASQGPMKCTVDDFWRMIWEQNVPLIVMLTQLEERGRERCAKYWPSDNEPMFYGELQVSLRSESVLDSYVIRIFDIQLGDKKRTIKQMHFIRWPDFGVPENAEMLLDFVNDVRIHLPHELNGPILVHCSAGVGRTGSFIAIDRLLQHIKHHDTLDIFGVVLEMRNYRLYMIQVEPQYILIHKCVLAAIKRGLHQAPENIYDNCVESIYENA